MKLLFISNTDKCVSVPTDEHTQRLSSSCCCHTCGREKHTGCVSSNNKCHTRVAAVLSSWFPVGIRCWDWVWAGAGLSSPPANTQSNPVMTLLSLFGGIRLGLLPPHHHHHHMAMEWNCSLHTAGELWAAIVQIQQLLGMSPESLSASHWWHPPVLLLSHTSWGELLYFHLKIHIKSAHGNVPLTPTTTWSTPPVYFGLPLLVAGSPWAAGLVGEAESGSRSQNPVSSLMGQLAPLPVASVHQPRPIMWRRHIWPGFCRE